MALSQTLDANVPDGFHRCRRILVSSHNVFLCEDKGSHLVLYVTLI